MNRKRIVVCAGLIMLLIFGGLTSLQKSEFMRKANENVRIAQEALVRPHSPILGRESAPVTIVEFFDPACETCRIYYPLVVDILEKYPDDVRGVLRYVSFHQGSDEAISILEAARHQNLFSPVLLALFRGQKEWGSHKSPDLNVAWDLAAKAGMDIERGKIDAKDPAIATIIEQDTADRKSNKVTGAPTFFINGKQLVYRDRRTLMNAVDREVSKVKVNSASQVTE
jgi:protein-disulfide isomerase